MNFNKLLWGETHDQQQVHRYLLINDNGMEVELSDFGALILSIRLPVNGELRDVVLGYDTLEEYYNNGAGFGAYIGRNGNRIGGAKVTIAGKTYELEQNDNGNNLHSGSNRSCYQFYETQYGVEKSCIWVEFSRTSPHMEQGFPGDLNQKIRYTLTNGNELMISYYMVSNKATVINPTNHCYFNLAGEGGGTILNHTMTLYSDTFLPTDNELIPTGEIRSVKGTPFDFRTPHKVGNRIEADYEPLNQAGGYDHNYCFANDGVLKKVGIIESPDADLSMTIFTDLCGMQVYSGNFLGGDHGKNGAIYNRRDGICFETQFYPNACNTPSFPSSIFAANTPYSSKTVYRFSWK